MSRLHYVRRLLVITIALTALTSTAVKTRPQYALATPNIGANAPTSTEAVESGSADDATKTRINERYGRVALSFERNQGQTDPRAEFISRGPGYTVFLVDGGDAVLALDAAVLRLKLVGSDRHGRAEGREELPGKSNYLTGNDRKRWRTGIPTYGRVAYESVYPGIDLVYYGNQRQLEYDFVVRPGADPRQIELAPEGADRMEIDAQGDLLLHVGGQEVRQRKPVVYQEAGGVRTEIVGRYKLQGNQRVRFQLGAYDRSRPLVIDPIILYSTYLGGSASDQGYGVAVDSTGSAYVTGRTDSLNFPVTVGAVDPAHNGNRDVFVTKLNPSGTALAYSTFLGGSNWDQGNDVAVDTGGNAYVTGLTDSTDFPTTALAFDTTQNGGYDAFVTKLDPTGTSLVYSTFLGGSGSSGDIARSVTVDTIGSAYVTGSTTSADFPTTPGAFQPTHNGDSDAFVTKLNTLGTALTYSTYLGGFGSESAADVAVDATGSAYVTGQTNSLNFPRTVGAFDTTYDGNSDAFVTKLNAAGATLTYSTLLGGSGFESGLGIAVDAGGSAYVTGFTESGFPITPGALDSTHNGLLDAFLTKLAPTGTALTYSTYLPGAFRDEIGEDVAVDVTGSAYVAGYTDSITFATADAFVMKVDPTGSTLAYSAYLGGTSHDHALGVALDGSGSAYVTGYTFSSNFPTTPGSFDTTNNGGEDAFVVKIGDAGGAPATLTIAPASDTNPVGQQHCVTATVRDAAANPVPGAIVRFSVAGANAASAAGTTDANGQAQFCYTGTNAGTDTISGYADTDADRTQGAGEPSSTATKTYIGVGPATLSLAPAVDTNPVSTTHCVTASVRNALNNPTPGVVVRFGVTGSVTTTGSATTNATGEAQFCYIGPAFPGADAITAYADSDGDNVRDAGEPTSTSTKNWVLPATTPLCEVTMTNGGRITANNGDRATFIGTARSASNGKISGQEQYEDHGPAQPLNVRSTDILAIVCDFGNPKTASIYGRTTINKQSYYFRINVTDVGDPGVGQDTYWILLGNGYDSGMKVLEGGDIQVRRR